jgi:glycosyltransferase involved in cell wall biosynthesis
MGMTNVTLSVIIIGRNEADGLRPLHDSLAALARQVECATIYVDSASTDRSIDVATSLFDATVVLEDDPRLSASAGRYVGAAMAAGEWMLFLDGDMILEPAIIPDLVDHMANRPGVGAIGQYIYTYPDGGSRVVRPKAGADGIADFFGGAVLLPAEAVRQESWDPRLFAYEEMELYTRLRHRGWHVRLIDKPFIVHLTERLPNAALTRGLFLRRGSILGKKYLGFGQVLASRMPGNLWSLVRWFPEPFVMWAALAVAMLCLAFDAPWAALVAGGGGIAFVCARKAPKFVIIYLALLPQAVHGVREFARDWRPRVRSVLARRSISAGGPT